MSIVQNVCVFLSFCPIFATVCDVDNVPSTALMRAVKQMDVMWFARRRRRKSPRTISIFIELNFRLSFDLFFRETFGCWVASGCCRWCNLPESSHSTIVQFCDAIRPTVRHTTWNRSWHECTIFEIDLMSECRMPRAKHSNDGPPKVWAEHTQHNHGSYIRIHSCLQTNARARATQMYINDIEIVSIYSVICPNKTIRF